jgi:sugar/nucleoside kinase (ribokinase family)
MILKDLLGNDHPLFAKNITELERATGDAGIDTKLVADITEKAHDIMRRMGLDPADTTHLELYEALKNAVHSGSAEILLAPYDYVLFSLDDGPISFNLQDVIENAHHELDYQDRKYDHGQRHLRMEIVRRYAEHERTHDEHVYQLTEEIGVNRPEDKTHLSMSIKKAAPLLFAVGDIFTDAFITLRKDRARIDTDPDGSKRLSMEFGSKPPYERADVIQAVGPSPNAAVACSRLGLRVGLRAFLGDDLPGKDSLAYLSKENIDTNQVLVQKDIKSNYYYVLRYGADRTILVKNEEYNYTWQDPSEVPDWLYLSLISESAWQLHEDMLAYLEKHPAVKLAFQPGTFHFEWGAEKLARVYKRSYIVVMNREEAALVTKKFEASVADLAAGLHVLGPEVVIITDGPHGSYASYGGRVTKMPNYPDPAPPFDRTGAGDAFASTIVAALALGKSIETALRWAPINSMSVVQELGAQAGLLNQEKIEEYLKNAPADYRAEEL